MNKLLFIDPQRAHGVSAGGGEALYMLVENGEVKADGANPAAIGWQRREALALGDEEAWWIPLGYAGGSARYAAVRMGQARASEALAFRPARQAGFLNLFQLARCERAEQQWAARAVHLGTWLHRTRFCGSCGHACDFIAAQNKRVCLNADCRAESYPRIEPAVIAMVVSGTRCLLARQASFPAGYFAPIAGFVDAGETPEQAVVREVFEETGLVVGMPAYVVAQPWPFPSSLMLGYIAEAAPGQQVRLSNELEAAEWFERSELIASIGRRERDGPLILPPSSVIGRAVIDAWLARIP